MEEVFRLYTPDELGADGYPFAWHRIEADDLGIGVLTTRRFGIKDLVREQAGHRCIRCHHPYLNGEHGNGEWSACDVLCSHLQPFRRVEPPRFEFAPDITPRDILLEEPDAQIEASWRILTVHHLDGDKANCRWWNLCSLCQRCHLTIQGRVVMERAFMFEHSEWMKPYASGWYAWKYFGEEITRAEALARQDELLGLERLA